MQIIVDTKKYGVEEGQSVLQALDQIGIHVPRLCYHPDLPAEGRCRMCIVEINGRIMTSCNVYVTDGMDIKTSSKQINDFRKLNLELMISNNPHMLDYDTDISRLAKEYGLKKEDVRFDRRDKYYVIDASSPSLCRDPSMCILCGKCITKCQGVQKIDAIGYSKRGHDCQICSYFNHPINEVACTFCGQCTNVCPTGAIKEKDYIHEVQEALNNSDKFVIVQTAPAVRASIGETQGMPAGSLVTGKLVAALRRLGFDRVLDTNFAADLTILEEGTEFIERLTNDGVLPMITSCSPGWINYIELFYPELIPHLSTCKSPQQMFGAIAKTYYAQKQNINPKDIIVVSIMPCTAKKYECQRDGMDSSGFADVDYVLTTRELGNWLNKEHIELRLLPDEFFDKLMGSSSGAGAIFGTTGGVMEAALRYAADVLENKDLQNVDYHPLRGLEGIKEAQLEIAGVKLKIAVAHGLDNAHNILEIIKKNPKKYDFVEIMACPGGCVGGGGQPIPTTKDIVQKRAMALYHQDTLLKLRKSHKNPEIQMLYSDFLQKPGSKMAHKLLHTHYKTKEKKIGQMKKKD
jgi:iron-only hydrogenase group A